jgi:hypothetical protein
LSTGIAVSSYETGIGVAESGRMVRARAASWS